MFIDSDLLLELLELEKPDQSRSNTIRCLKAWQWQLLLAATQSLLPQQNVVV